MARTETLKKLRETLVRRRNALQRALAGDLSLLQDVQDTGPGDLLDAAVDTAQTEVNSQLVEAETRELHLIDDALERINEGTYGICESCEKPIPLNRLQALPYATECIKCRRRAEQGPTSDPRWNRIFVDAPVDSP